MEIQTKIKLPEVGTCAIGTVVRVYQSYAIMLFDDGWTGLLHISELSNSFIHRFTAFVTIGTIYCVKVISVDETLGKIHVSLKRVTASDRKRAFAHTPINPLDIEFRSLQASLPEWIKQQNKETIYD